MSNSFNKKKLILNITIFIFLNICIQNVTNPLKADQNDSRLNGLFKNLKSTKNSEEASFFEIQIWNIWMEHKNPKVQKILFLGLEAMKNQEFERAFVYFSKIIKYTFNQPKTHSIKQI